VCLGKSAANLWCDKAALKQPLRLHAPVQCRLDLFYDRVKVSWRNPVALKRLSQFCYNLVSKTFEPARNLSSLSKLAELPAQHLRQWPGNLHCLVAEVSLCK
jgi:hypothetical protein